MYILKYNNICFKIIENGKSSYQLELNKCYAIIPSQSKISRREHADFKSESKKHRNQ